MKNYIKYFTILGVALMFTSCLVDETAPSEDNDKGPNFVGFTRAAINASVTADGTEKEVLLGLQVTGPTVTEFEGEFTAKIEVDPSSTAIEGVHYRLSTSTVTISSSNNGLATVPVTIITEGIDPPLDANPELIIKITEVSDNNIVPNGRTGTINVKVEYLCFSDITGKYKAIVGAYFRIGVGPNCVAADWPDETEIIYICRNTYRVIEWFGCFDGNEWYFEVDESGKITYPATTPDGDPQNGNGQPLITCESNPDDFAGDVPCGPETNYVDRSNGKVTLYMTYGYYTPNSGPRTFYHQLEKIVE